MTEFMFLMIVYAALSKTIPALTNAYVATLRFKAKNKPKKKKTKKR
ncbi:hypothetical protein AB9M62_57150 [Bacillales bacterium AN1005]